MNERLERFVSLMRGIFELDKSDLDFGIYRIMNIRKAKIEEFLTEGLPRKVQDTLAPFAGDLSSVTQRMQEIEQQCAQIGIRVEDSPVLAAEYAQLKQQKAAGSDMSALETDVYSALYSFFSRYYDEGDFISKRRYKEGVYAIPYEGEEVKLYWANQDQYYIKTSENFKDYTFVDGDLTVHFRLVDATQEQNNNKESEDSKRVFMLYTETEEQPELHTFDYDAEKKELIIRFVFDIPEEKGKDIQKKYAEKNNTAITEWLARNHPELVAALLRLVSTDPKKPVTLMQKHLTAYVAKNTFDYFIHKDLGGFLRRELDFYIKNEIMHLDDLDTDNERRVETWLAKVKAVKRVGHIIIDFLAQIEDFQKKLWLKKKFVVETNWCITLDNIDESFWPEIAGNAAQVQEWISMYAINEAEGWTNPPTKDFLRANTNLVVDTKHFTPVFRDKLIADIDGLDEKTNGLMVWGDNFHALNVLKEQSKGRIDCTYIDPPYNSDASPIQYKNGYKSSSWCTLLFDRISITKTLLKQNGVLAVSIDDVQQVELVNILKTIFGDVLGVMCVRSNPSGRPTQTGYSVSHEYIDIAGNTSAIIGRLPASIDQMKRFNYYDENGSFEWRNLRREGSNSDRSARRGLYYPLYITESAVRVPQMFWNADTEEWIPQEAPNDNELIVWPINDDGQEKTWRWGPEKVSSSLEYLCVRPDRSGNPYVYYKRYANDEGVVSVSSWFDAKYSATEHGTALLKDLFYKTEFKFPKSLYTVMDVILVSGGSDKRSTVLDYFAGSSTTGHAVLSLNRADNGQRKYILVEMGNYFSTVTKPRMQKVIYSADWKDGKPTTRNTGISQIMKYIRLESYEDALSNVELDTAQGDILSGLFGDEYLVHYMLNQEANGSLLNIDAFRDPFSYRMKITENNEAKLRPVDLVETFNYLIGLTVSRHSSVDWFQATPDDHGEYEGAVRIQRDDGGDFAFQQIEGTLPDGRKALVIWRNVTDDVRRSNAALDAYFRHYRINPGDREYDVIYVNGDNNLENIRRHDEQWKVIMTETEFKARMFEEE